MLSLIDMISRCISTSRNGLLASVTHDTVAKRFAHVEEKFVAFLLRVLDVLLIPHEFRDRIGHVRTIIEHRQAVGIEQRIAKPSAIDATVVSTFRAR